MVVVTDVTRDQIFIDDDSSSFVTDEGSDIGDENSDISDSEELEKELAQWRAGDETLADRLYALKDMVSPTTRKKIANAWKSTSSWTVWGGKLAGNAVWVVTTSALLVGLPLALAIENESMMVQQEKEVLAQQQGAQQMMGNIQPGQAADSGLRPPGF